MIARVDVVELIHMVHETLTDGIELSVETLLVSGLTENLIFNNVQPINHTRDVRDVRDGIDPWHSDQTSQSS